MRNIQYDIYAISITLEPVLPDSVSKTRNHSEDVFPSLEGLLVAFDPTLSKSDSKDPAVSSIQIKTKEFSRIDGEETVSPSQFQDAESSDSTSDSDADHRGPNKRKRKFSVKRWSHKSKLC